jgi:hypothetical protein
LPISKISLIGLSNRRTLINAIAGVGKIRLKACPHKNEKSYGRGLSAKMEKNKYLLIVMMARRRRSGARI